MAILTSVVKATLHSLIILVSASMLPAIAYGDDNIFIRHARYAPISYSNHYLPPKDAATEFHLPRHLHIAEHPDPEYLLEQSYTLAGASFVTIGLMTLLPEEVTNWDSSARKLDNLGNKWWDNITAGPRWDNDDDYLNYVMHPYFGGVYYTSARHAGYNRYDSFLYSFAVSTFFWECGVEAVTERPSIQDIVVTPIFGAWAGDAMLYREQRILANGGRVMGSETLGNISLFFLNPIGHIHHWVTDSWGDEARLSFYYRPERYRLSFQWKF
jgi:hypothetical protein